MKEYPLYPELPEDGKIEAQRLIDKFKEHIKKDIENLLGDLYVDVACHIETDSWGNYRNVIMDGMIDYNNRNIQAKYDFKKIRKQIYKDFRKDIVKDLDQDNLEKIKELEEKLEKEREWNRRLQERY